MVVSHVDSLARSIYESGHPAISTAVVETEATASDSLACQVRDANRHVVRLVVSTSNLLWQGQPQSCGYLRSGPTLVEHRRRKPWQQAEEL